MRVLFEIGTASNGIDEGRMTRCAELAMRSLELPGSTELSITLVDEDEMAKLNEGYRGKTGPTDVLSFECDMLDDGFPASPDGEDEYFLGDVIICPSVAKRQALELGHSLDEELDTLLIHGILHLCGYDHVDDGEAAVMQGRQDELLLGWRSKGATASSASDCACGLDEHAQSDADERLVRHAHDSTPFPLAKAFSCATCGIKYTWLTQRNIKIQAAIGILALALGFILQIDMASWCAIVICIALVLSLEIVNTAIESVVDMASPDWHKLAMHAKDCGAGAVYVAAAASLVIACIVYIPAAIELFGLMG